jgi:hypothetical protein
MVFQKGDRFELHMICGPDNELVTDVFIVKNYKGVGWYSLTMINTYRNGVLKYVDRPVEKFDYFASDWTARSRNGELYLTSFSGGRVDWKLRRIYEEIDTT